MRGPVPRPPPLLAFKLDYRFLLRARNISRPAAIAPYSVVVDNTEDGDDYLLSAQAEPIPDRTAPPWKKGCKKGSPKAKKKGCRK